MVKEEISLDTLYDLGFSQHVVQDYEGHKVDECPICQAIIKQGKLLYKNSSKRRKGYKIHPNYINEGNIDKLKYYVNKKLTPVEIGAKMKIPGKSISDYCHSHGIKVWNKKYKYHAFKDGHREDKDSLDAVSKYVSVSRGEISTNLQKGAYEVKGFLVTREEIKY